MDIRIRRAKSERIRTNEEKKINRNKNSRPYTSHWHITWAIVHLSHSYFVLSAQCLTLCTEHVMYSHRCTVYCLMDTNVTAVPITQPRTGRSSNTMDERPPNRITFSLWFSYSIEPISYWWCWAHCCQLSCCRSLILFIFVAHVTPWHGNYLSPSDWRLTLIARASMQILNLYGCSLTDMLCIHPLFGTQ